VRQQAPRNGHDVRAVLEFIDAHLGERLTLVRMAGEAKLNPYHFAHMFKHVTGVAPHQYIMQRRLERAKLLLAQTNLPIVEIATELGYASQSHFSELFRRATGITPMSYRLRR